MIDNALRWAPETGVAQIPLHIFPFRMTAENLKRHAASEWVGFWYNLKQGYDIFEHTRLVPVTAVENKTYVFEVPEPVISDPLAMATMKLINAMHS